MRRLLVMRLSMIAPNGDVGKGFAVAFTVTQVRGGGTRDHAFVRPFIMPPRFGPAPVHLDRHKTITGFGSVRVSDSSAPQPPGACAGRLLCFCSVRFNPPTLRASASWPFFLWEFAVGLRPAVFSRMRRTGAPPRAAALTTLCQGLMAGFSGDAVFVASSDVIAAP